jgi:hypothetical protein
MPQPTCWSGSEREFASCAWRSGYIQPLILAVIPIIVSLSVCLIGLIAEMVRLNRKMLEEALYRVRQMELENQAGGNEQSQ